MNFNRKNEGVLIKFIDCQILVYSDIKDFFNKPYFILGRDTF